MKFSIITAVYNNRDFIEGCLKSVLGQDYKDIEYIIIDGGSADGTLDILNRYAKGPVIVRSGKDKGVFDAWNKGLKLSSGEVIGFLNSDDLYADRSVIGRVSAAFDKSGAESIYGNLVYVDRSNTDRIIRYWRAGEFREGLMKLGWMPPHPTFFAKKRLFDDYGVFDTAFPISSDYEILVRLLHKYRASCAFLDEVLVKMRLGGQSNRSLANLIQKSREDYSICRKYGLGIKALLLKNAIKIPQFILRP